MRKEIRNFRALPPEYWRARISGTDFEAAIRYAEREGLRRGAAILFARHANPAAYNAWRAKQNPNVQRMTQSASKVQSFAMPRGFRIVGG